MPSAPLGSRDLWRISNLKSLRGEGGTRFSARWHTAGKRIVYLADSAAGALIEILVHLELTETQIPAGYTLLRVHVPSGIRFEAIEPPGAKWKTRLALSRGLGDVWLARNQTALARVPSAILPSTSNYLLNPTHPDAKQIKIVEATRAKFDARLVRHLEL